MLAETATAFTDIDGLAGKEKAAILLITMGPEKSAQVFKHLKEEEIESLTLEIANTSIVSPETKEAVLQEFYQICIAQQYITEGGIAYAKQILEKALGETKAFEVISKLTVSLKARPFEFIRKTDASQLLNFIQNEHPQIIALILSYLKPQQAGQVIVELTPEKQADVAKRIAKMDRTSPDVIKEVEKALEKKLSALMLEDYTTVGGVDSVVDILNVVDRATEKNIMETLEIDDVELAEEIRRKMFVFEDIASLTGRDIQNILRQTGDFDDRDLAIALKGSNENVQEIIFTNVSKRKAGMLREEMEYLGPIRRSDVEDAQQKIVNVVRKLQDSGEIVIARGGGDEIIV
ncbi:MAG: flagellar motor switch protein FliG [Clostridiales bacterium]|nr:flagellar motor switch protein FliG [Clostridiales bacterium]